MISLIDSIHETLVNDVSAYHFTFTTDNNEKVKNAKRTIKETAEHLEVSIRKFHLAQVALEMALNKVENAMKSVCSVNESMLALFKERGRVLCGMLGRQMILHKGLHSSKVQLERVKQDAHTTVAEVNKVVVKTVATDTLARLALSNVTEMLTHHSFVPDEKSQLR
ncbi:hypothetical protein ERJ75_000482300 [Trypanosoma vivax]|nr:hypothetical protein ERJ75_000483900 [Trypanosoma vivax]KAH8616398.1 hypothetical protein ERJ75_000482300 [Trypanosoma vivax]